MERDLLEQLAARWGRRVAVKKDELDLDGHFDPDAPDFPEPLVPVSRLAGYRALDPAARQRILAAAWIAYNAKTTAVEEEIVLPACRLMLSGAFPGRRDATAGRVLHQTIIDEHYHVLMCHNASGVTRRRRGLGLAGFEPTEWSVVREVRAGRQAASPQEADLTALAFALAAETTINAFLVTVSSATDIQPMNRMTVELHRQDETGHAVVFRELIAPVYRELGTEERLYFDDALKRGLTAFRRPDHEPWVAVAAEGGLSTSADELADAAATAPPMPRDTEPLRRLLDELGIADGFAL